MKVFFVVLASILSALTMATHVPGHLDPKYWRHPKYFNAEDRVLQDGGGLGDDDDNGGGDIGGGIGGDDIGGGLGGIGGGLGDLIGGGLGGIGGIGGGGGYRALRGIDDKVEDDGTAMNDNDEIVVVGGRTVVRGGAVVARPGPRRWY